MIIINFLILTACSSTPQKVLDSSSTSQQTGKVLLASGYSKPLPDPQLTLLQNQTIAEQTAKLEAYRALAIKLYNEKLSNGRIVANQIIQNEAYRIYLDLFLRDARVVESNRFAGQQKIALELTLTPHFYQCFSTEDKVTRCIQESNKVPYTRLGYQQAPVSTINISCASSDCGDQLSMSGFSEEKKGLDSTLLNHGFYDTEWSINTVWRTALRYVFLSQIVF